MLDELFHQFLLDGGQVTSSISSGSRITLPDHWSGRYDVAGRKEVQAKILAAALTCADFPGVSVLETSAQLRIPYHGVLKLIRMQELGSVKIGKRLQIYQPCIQAYVERLSERKPCNMFQI